MTHEPGRERHMIHKCEKCRCIVPAGELYYSKEYDEYWCEGCVSNAPPMKYENLGWVEQLQGYASKFTVSGRSFINVFPSTKLTELTCPAPAERLNSDAAYVEMILGYSIEEFINADDK